MCAGTGSAMDMSPLSERTEESGVGKIGENLRVEGWCLALILDVRISINISHMN